MNKPMLRWGILGCAQIALKNWKAIWNSSNGSVVAVASRALERSRRFIDEAQKHAPFQPAPVAFGSYEELLASDKVEALYIPLPTGIRGEWVKRAAEAGKHVVCEKPCARSVAELTEMIEACRHNQVQFMDGVMFMHSNRLQRMHDALAGVQAAGGIRRITSAFTFNAGEEFFASNIRTRSELEPHGCLGDLGWYCIRFALWAMNWALPERVAARVLAEFKHAESASAVPIELSAELFFPAGVTSSFYCSFTTETEQWAIVSGTRGHLRVMDFVLPFSGSELVFETGNPVFDVHGCDFEMQPRNLRWVVEESSHSDTTAQESVMFRRFAEQVQSGALNPFWPEVALKTQRVMEACRESSSRQGALVELR